MVCPKITGINILGLIYTKKMRVDGKTVDLAKIPLANTNECAVVCTLDQKKKNK